MIVLDTNVIILFAKGDERTVQWLEKQRDRGEVFAVSIISEIELLGFHKITEQEKKVIERWLQFCRVIDVGQAIAQIAVNLRRTYKLETPDSIIAATSFLMHAPLASHDAEIRRVKEIEVVTTK